MKLPQSLFLAVKTAMEHHGQWHLARIPRAQVKMADRPKWDVARSHFSQLTPRNKPGAGTEFLRMHHDMIEHFKQLVRDTPDHDFVYRPWTELPQWLRSRLPAAYVEAAEARIAELIEHGTEEELGAFIESSHDHSRGSDLHNRIHGMIGWIEYALAPTNPDTAAATMDNFDFAHLNEHFWGLHGWIDEKYAAWKLAHGVNPAPDPDDGHHHHHNHGEITVNPAVRNIGKSFPASLVKHQGVDS